MAFRVLQWCHPMLASSLRTSCCTRMITLYGDRNWIQARALTSCSNSRIWFSVQVSILRGAYTEWQRLIQVNGDAWEWVWDPFSSGTMHSNETLPLPFSLFTPLNGTVMVAILLFFVMVAIQNGQQNFPLLDQVGCAIIGDFHLDQRHLTLTERHMTPYGHKKKVCVWNKTFRLGPIVWHKVISCFTSPLFIMFQYM